MPTRNIPGLVLSVIACTLMLGGAASAQANAARPEVSAAVVRYVCPTPQCTVGMGGGISIDPVHYSCVNCGFVGLAMEAFEVEDPRQIQAPPALQYVWYSMEMTVSAPVDKPTMMGLMRGVFVQAFGLKWHTQVKVYPATALVVAKGGPKFRALGPAAPGEPPYVAFDQSGWHFQTIDQLLNYLNSFPEQADRRIIDETGLAGRYQIDLHMRPLDLMGPGPSPLPGMIKEQLGLDFAKTTKTAQVEYIVIDSAQELRGTWTKQ